MYDIAAQQTAAAVLAIVLVQCVAIAVYLQLTRTQEALETDYCYTMQVFG
jgi:hypothetical protein